MSGPICFWCSLTAHAADDQPRAVIVRRTGRRDVRRLINLVADYCADLKSAGLIKSVHVQNGWDPSDAIGETKWLQSKADVHGFPNAIVAYADLSSPDAERILADHSRFANVRGIRQILNWREDPRFRVASSLDLMTQAAWRRGFALLSRYGLSFDLQIYWSQMDDALELARAYSETPIILNYFGMPIYRTPEGVDAWRMAIGRLSRAKNVYAKLSGLGLGHPRWTVEDTIPLSSVINAFGIERCMLGTNLPVDLLFSDVSSIMETFRILTSSLADEERAAIYQTNARGYL